MCRWDRKEIGTWVAEHWKSVERGDVNSSSIVEHTWMSEPQLDWSSMTILAMNSYYYSKLAIEAMYIRKQNKPLNSDTGQPIGRHLQFCFTSRVIKGVMVVMFLISYIFSLVGNTIEFVNISLFPPSFLVVTCINVYMVVLPCSPLLLFTYSCSIFVFYCNLHVHGHIFSMHPSFLSCLYKILFSCAMLKKAAVKLLNSWTKRIVNK